jgi:hypothetical protein
MTQEEIFLAWCKERKLKFKKTVGPSKNRTYELNHKHDMVLVVQGVTFKLNPIQESDSLNVYFDKDGKWYGGTNMIWNTGLPWERK